jgi:hypothetical protein
MDTQKLQKSEGFDLQPVREKFIKDTKCDEALAQDLEREVKRFLLVTSEAKGKSIRLYRNGLDDFWHTFILHTDLYQKYCSDVLGVFVHHMPGTSRPKNQDEINQRNSDYEFFLDNYKNTFNTEAPGQLWPKISDTNSISCVGCSGCGVHWRAYVG